MITKTLMTEPKITFADQKRKTVETAEFTEDGRYKRKVRSFVLRTGRLSEFQRQMMNDNWADYGLDYQTEPFDFPAIYGNRQAVIVEIGFGMGKSLVEMAEQNPDKNYLGIEVHTPGVGACLAYAIEKGVKNLRVVCHDATEILRDCIADHSLGGLQLFFPIPGIKQNIINVASYNRILWKPWRKNWRPAVSFISPPIGKIMPNTCWTCYNPYKVRSEFVMFLQPAISSLVPILVR